MSSLDGQNLFASGPHTFRLGPWERRLERRALPGLTGEVVIDLGVRGRAIHQAGRLCAANRQALQAVLSAVEASLDGRTHTLVDGHGQSYGAVMLEQFELTGPIRQGRGFWCDYACRYLQLP